MSLSLPQSAWMPESELFPYMEFSSKFNKPSNRRGFSEALKEVDELMRKTQKGVVKTTDPSDQEVGLHSDLAVLLILTAVWSNLLKYMHCPLDIIITHTHRNQYINISSIVIFVNAIWHSLIIVCTCVN